MEFRERLNLIRKGLDLEHKTCTLKYVKYSKYNSHRNIRTKFSLGFHLLDRVCTSTNLRKNQRSNDHVDSL